MDVAPLTDQEFRQFQQMIADIAGIHLSPAKKMLVSSRLGKRIRQRRCNSFGEYYRYLHGSDGREELQVAVDLLTTNETYFFREPAHFDFLMHHVLPARRPNATFRVWSAACSSGEEPYSIAMVLAASSGRSPWEVLASDISTRMLQQASSGRFPLQRTRNIPVGYLSSYCLKGVGSQEGSLLVKRELRQRAVFRQINLNQPLPDLGRFDVIFLRNVMIYFDLDTKREVVDRLLQRLRPGGYFLVGHSESLHGVTDKLETIKPSIYRLA